MTDQDAIVQPLRSERLKGHDLYLGGERGSGSVIYGVPGTAKKVLKIDTAFDYVETVGSVKGPLVESSLPQNQFKWLRGIFDHDSQAMFGLPSNADCVLRVDRDDSVTILGRGMAELKGNWKWHGGVQVASGFLYGVPCNATRVLKVSPKTNEVNLVGPTIEGNQKWYGGLLGCDGCMYGIPNCHTSVLKFDPHTEEVSFLGELPEGGWKFHGGVVGLDDCIYGVPAHSNQGVLKVDVRKQTVRVIGGPLRQDDPHNPSSKYKYGGAVVGEGGIIYCLPSDASRVLMCNPQTEEVKEIGPTFPGKNKWQNGFLLSDGAVYGIPCNARRVIRIKGENVTLVGPDLGPEKEKWEGGVLANDSIYCMPQEADFVLKIFPVRFRHIAMQRAVEVAAAAGLLFLALATRK